MTDLGIPAHRSQQFKGSGDSADVRFNDNKLNCLIHIEVKRNETLNVFTALTQAARDAAVGQTPVVMHRKNSTPWVVTLSAEDFFDLFKERYEI